MTIRPRSRLGGGGRARRAAAAGLTATMAVSLLAGCGTDGEANVINVYAPADGASAVAKVAATCAIDGYKVVVHSGPKQADDQRLQVARRLAGNDRAVDVIGMDVNWTAEFAEAGWILPLPEDMAAAAKKTVLGGPLKTAMWKDTLYASPAWTNTQLLWYRKDVMDKVLAAKHPASKTPAPKKPAPKKPGTPAQAPLLKLTWDDVVAYAAAAGEMGLPTQIEVPAAQYEGVVVWFNTLIESAGGRMLADDGKTVTLTDTPEHRAATVKALSIMKAVATAPGHDPSFTQLNEGSARLNMESGKALFELNWPFVFPGIQTNAAAGAVPFLSELTRFSAELAPKAPPLTKDQAIEINKITRQKFEFAPYPSVIAGKPAKTTVGGINFAVAKTTRYRDQAFQVIDCLTNEAAETVYTAGGTPPILAKLYDDPEFNLKFPMASVIRDQLQDATAAVRPITPMYTAMSTLLQAKLAPVGAWDPEQLADQLTEAAKRAMDGKGLVP